MSNQYPYDPNFVYQAQAIPVEVQAIPVHANAPIFSSSAPPTQFNDAGAREYLSSYKWPVGLQDAFVKNLSKVPIRYFICDDSGSMMANDGHKLIEQSGNKKMISCSRWTELTDTLKFHAGIARAASAPTEFRLLNSAAPIMLGTNDYDEGGRFDLLMIAFAESPNGGTPLCRHINDVIEKIRALEPQLRASNQRACLIIATDGESSDGDIAKAMQPLKNLPVWVVIRLCTDEDKIVNYWNNIDSELEVEMDVLDDLTGEAGEVNEHNPWLNYGEPLQKIREFGIPVKEFDLLDETKLSLDQVRKICALIYGGDINSYPHPEADWSGFESYLRNLNKKTVTTWNPATKLMEPWVNVTKLAHHFHKSGGCTIC